MARKANERGKLSTLELTVLGLAWLRGPCTIYAIMKDLSISASSFHRSRAGTAYSVAKRLLEFGLLQKQPDDAILITPAGEAALKQWLTPPGPFADGAHSADLLRLRFFFLEAVDLPTRLAFIDASIEGLRAFLIECDNLIPENEAISEYYGLLATASMIFETKARIKWLELVREFVANPEPPSDGSSWTAAVRKALGRD